MPGPTPHYPPEFKREAVELCRSSEQSIPKMAEECTPSGIRPAFILTHPPPAIRGSLHGSAVSN